MLVSCFACMFVALGARHGLRDTELRAGMVQCKAVRLGVSRVKAGAGGSHFGFGRMRGWGRGFVKTSFRMVWQFPQVMSYTHPYQLWTNERRRRLVGGGKESRCEEEAERCREGFVIRSCEQE